MKHDIRPGDVWRSEKSGRDVPVESVTFECGYPVITYRGVKGALTVATAAAFVRGRTLIERGGVRVGDLRSMGKASTLRVLSIAGDNAECDDHPARGRSVLIHLDVVAAMPLLTRDGKAVT